MKYKIYHCRRAELFKVENFQNSIVKDVLKSIYDYFDWDADDIQENFDDLDYLLNIEGDFSKPKLAYIYILDDSRTIITDTLEIFKDKTEKDWGVDKWRLI
jgi:hypothetical protein